MVLDTFLLIGIKRSLIQSMILDRKNYVEFIEQDTFEILDVLINDKPIDAKYLKIVQALKSFN